MNLRTPWALAAGVIVLAICLQSETIQRVVRTANFSTSTAARGAMQLFRFAFAKSGMTNKSSYTPDMVADDPTASLPFNVTETGLSSRALSST